MKIKKPQLKKKILEMVRADMKMRRKADKGYGFDKALDEKHTQTMKKIIKKYGWPTVTMVGKKASWGSWLLVQHADHDLFFQKKCLKLMQQAVEKNSKDILKSNIALMQDRILVSQNKKQMYGTQLYFNNKKGEFVPSPISDLKNLDARRKEYGLSTFKEYLAEAKKYKPKRKIK